MKAAHYSLINEQKIAKRSQTFFKTSPLNDMHEAITVMLSVCPIDMWFYFAYSSEKWYPVTSGVSGLLWRHDVNAECELTELSTCDGIIRMDVETKMWKLLHVCWMFAQQIGCRRVQGLILEKFILPFLLSQISTLMLVVKSELTCSCGVTATSGQQANAMTPPARIQRSAKTPVRQITLRTCSRQILLLYPPMWSPHVLALLLSTVFPFTILFT